MTKVSGFGCQVSGMRIAIAGLFTLKPAFSRAARDTARRRPETKKSKHEFIK
jgi:hypothetical protein